MIKTEHAGADANLTPGKTSITGSNVLSRTEKNAPANEPQIRGVLRGDWENKIHANQYYGGIPIVEAAELLGLVVIDDE